MYLKKSILLISLLIFNTLSHGQVLKKHAIDKSGCSAMFYCDPGKFEVSTSPDSSIMYTAECSAADITYELICVKLKQKATNIDRAAEVLEQYLDFLKGSYAITESAGYTKGLRLKKLEATRGIKDVWKDQDNNHISIRGWTNGRFMVVLMAVSSKDLPDIKINKYLDGVFFPGMK